MTRGNLQESEVVAVVQERRMEGMNRIPRIYAMANGNELTVVWSGEDRILLPESPHASTSILVLMQRGEQGRKRRTVQGKAGLQSLSGF